MLDTLIAYPQAWLGPAWPAVWVGLSGALLCASRDSGASRSVRTDRPATRWIDFMNRLRDARRKRRT